MKGGENMKKYMLLYTNSKSAAEHMEGMSAEDTQKMMQPWNDWKDAVGDALVDFGTPMGNAMNVSMGRSSKSSQMFNGYSILQAENWKEVEKLLMSHPFYNMEGAGIEVFELMPMGM